MQNTQSTTNMVPGSQFLSQFTNNCKEPVFTLPISVKPKTREPASFTDNRIYVSNIPFSFREQDLASMFFKYGRVLSVEIVTNDRGSKGFGFVTLDSIDSCEKARAALHESHVQGRIIEVRRATPTRRKLINNPQNELLPPPRLCVDLRAPHNQWRTEPTHQTHNFPAAGFMMAPYGDRFGIGASTQNRTMFGDLTNNYNMAPSSSSLRCMKHSELKLSSAGEYFCKNGEVTTENSLLMCMNRQNISCSNHGCNSSNHELSDVDLNSVFPNHLRDQITALLDTSNHFGSGNNSARKAPSVNSGTASSESEAVSDEEHWTPNHSPDLLASLYEGSTSFHGELPGKAPSNKNL